ncbi:MAG: hypothetical protein N3A38_09120 [Planctomycetota bacterium]|nr:hypothetical protein [Planctomycetota bacterium]
MVAREWYFFHRVKRSMVFVAGYYPSNFDWTIETLPKRKGELRKLIFILDGSGLLPIVQAGCMPLPMIYSDITKYLGSEKSCEWVRVKWGDVKGNRFIPDRICKAFVPVPRRTYKSLDEVPPDENFAVAGGRFFFSGEVFDILGEAKVWLEDVHYYPASKARRYPAIAYPPKNYDHLFVRRPEMPEKEAEDRIFAFCLESLRKFAAEGEGKLSAILLDTDPGYGYVIMALKTSETKDVGDLDDIGQYEYDNYAEINADRLYGDCEYLPEKKLTAALTRAIRRLAAEPAVKTLARPEGLRIGYGVHDKPVRLIASVECK